MPAPVADPPSGTGDASKCWSMTPRIMCSSSAIRPNDDRILSKSSRPMTRAPEAGPIFTTF
eukprot:14080230-Heterocapsa_arctica.AAC.1